MCRKERILVWKNSVVIPKLKAWNQQQHSPSRQCAAEGATRFRHLPSLIQLLVSDYPITDADMTSYADDFTLLASASSIVEAKPWANLLQRWAEGKQLPIACQKSSVMLFSSDTLQSWLHLQVQIRDEMTPLNRTPKILGITLDYGHPFYLGPSHPRLC